MWKVGQKYPFFQMSVILKFDFQKTITFFWSKLSKLHKKDPILHVATTFFLKQGETEQAMDPFHIPQVN